MWKKLLAELGKMRKATAANAYRTAEIVRDLYANQQWIDGECKGDKFAADKKLNEYAGLYGMTAPELAELVNYIPDKQRWLEGRLDLLKDEMITARQRERTLQMKARQTNEASKTGLSPFKGRKNKTPVAGNVANPPQPVVSSPVQPDAFESLTLKVKESTAELLKTVDDVSKLQAELTTERERRIKAEARVLELEGELGGLRLRFQQLQKKA